MGRQRVGLPLVVARIVVVLGLGFTAAVGIFWLVAGYWREGLVSLGAALAFLALMFVVERRAELG